MLKNVASGVIVMGFYLKTIPSRFCLVSGFADADFPLNAFDKALINAGIGDTNLVRLSSILPPFCEYKEQKIIGRGQLLPVAYASKISSKQNQLICSAIAVGIPKDSSLPGLIMELSTEDVDGMTTRQEIEKMLIAGMETRNREIKEIMIKTISHVVIKHGATFAGVVFW